MKKVLVYGKTYREATRFYPLKEGILVGYRTYEEHGNGEECDEEVFVNGDIVKKTKKVKKDGV